MDDNFLNIDRLINGALSQKGWLNTLSLNEIFNHKLEELGISKNQALKVMDIETKSFDAFMQGSSTKMDYLIVLKMSIFLDMSAIDFLDKFLSKIIDDNSKELEKTKIRNFIAKNFDLEGLRKIGFIDTVNDFAHIEKKILDFFGYDSVFEYRREIDVPAYSSSKIKSNIESQRFWVNMAYATFEKIFNPNDYDREALVKLFPTLRAYSLNMENGLALVMKLLFKVGVTVVFIPKIYKDLHIRAATFCVSNKPCIALTNYRDFYPTLWFALIHELYHVLYDWDEICSSESQSHLSAGISTGHINEDAANEFARKYLFDDDKMRVVEDNIDDDFFVTRFARSNNVHPSIVYALYAYTNSTSENKIFGKYRHLLPSPKIAIDQFEPNKYESYIPIPKIAKTTFSLIS